MVKLSVSNLRSKGIIIHAFPNLLQIFNISTIQFLFTAASKKVDLNLQFSNFSLVLLQIVFISNL